MKIEVKEEFKEKKIQKDQIAQNSPKDEDKNVKSNNHEYNKILNGYFKKIINILFSNRLFVVLISIILLLKTILLYKVQIFRVEPLQFSYIYTSFAFICVILAIPMLFKDKIRFWVTLIFDFLISMLLFINELYYSFSTNLVSVSQISNLQYGREISISLPYLLQIKQILYFIDILIFLTIYFSMKIKIKKQPKTSYIVGVIYLVFVVILINNPIKEWITEAEKNQYNKILQIESSSIYGYHYLDLKNNINMKKNVKYKTKSAVMQAYRELINEYKENYELEYNYVGLAQDKNVIIIQLESVQNFVVNRTINGKEITPNLNKFLNENIEFTNMQNQSYSTTADSEFTVMNSLYPLENGMCFAQYSSNDYDNMYKKFKQSGYITTYIHGNEGGFWNRNAVYSRLPIDNLIFDDAFDENVERINNFVSDEQVYRKAIEEMKNYDGKFMVNIVAASSHTAFDLPGIEDKAHKVNIDVGDEYRDIYFGNYLEAVNYADYAFGILINELKKAGLYDNSVILVYGDHAGLQMYNWEMQDFIEEIKPLNDIKTQINFSNVLCGIKIPGIEKMRITKPTSKLDLKPTLLEICGIKDNFSLGQSMFSNKDFVCLNNGRIITDRYFYDGNWYSIRTGEQIDMETLTQEEVSKLNNYVKYMQKELDISLSINVLNLLK